MRGAPTGLEYFFIKHQLGTHLTWPSPDSKNEMFFNGFDMLKERWSEILSLDDYRKRRTTTLFNKKYAQKLECNYHYNRTTAVNMDHFCIWLYRLKMYIDETFKKIFFWLTTVQWINKRTAFQFCSKWLWRFPFQMRPVMPNLWVPA